MSTFSKLAEKGCDTPSHTKNWACLRAISSSFEKRSEEHTSEPSHEWISYAVFCLKKKKKNKRSEGAKEKLRDRRQAIQLERYKKLIRRYTCAKQHTTTPIVNNVASSYAQCKCTALA